jgi:hypothetical protein
MAYDCEFVFCERALALGHFLSHIQNEFPVLLA